MLRMSIKGEVLPQAVQSYDSPQAEQSSDSPQLHISEDSPPAALSMDRVELLMEFSSILNSSLDTSRVREAAMKATCRLLECEGATLYLLDENTNELVFETMVGTMASQQRQEIRLKLDGKNPAATAAMERRPLLRNSQLEHNRSILCVPLISKGHLLGVLQAINRTAGAFSAQDLRLLVALSHQVAVAVENATLYENLEDQFHETIEAIATTIEAKDSYTGGHTKRVAHYSVLIARHMGLPKSEIVELRLAAMLHDLGKIGVADHVLKKAAPLDRDEWEQMRQHPELGWRILANVSSMRKIAEGMRFHHERPDGSGYPHGLKGEEIPLIARIISVADTFDAMTSTRPYRKGLEPEIAYEEILRHRGRQFDEKVVDGFARAFKMEGMGKKRTEGDLA